MNSDAARKQSDTAESAVEMVIKTRARDLVEGFKVRRALPSRGRRMVGPFIFGALRHPVMGCLPHAVRRDRTGIRSSWGGRTADH
jgi:hypothetical protein